MCSLLTGAAGLVVSMPSASMAKSSAPVALDELAQRFPPGIGKTTTALELLVEVAAPIRFGAGPYGERRLVPITGGVFRGPGLSGRVLAGGADRQTMRADGIRELDATYELQADDGTILMVRNRVIIDEQRQPAGERRYARSVVTVTAPEGPHDWLNRRILVGTLHSLRPAAPAVFLRFSVIE